MITEIDNFKWDELVKENNLTIFFYPNYLSSIKTSFGVNIKYYSSFEDTNLLFLAAVFSKNNNVIIPDNFTYNPCYVSPNLSERKQIAIHKQFIEILKNKYKSISIKFNVDILDIRPYKWAGFNVDVRYTYIKKTNEPSHSNIDKNLKKATKMGVLVEVNTPNIKTINLSTNFLKNLNYQDNLIFNYVCHLNNLSLQNLLICFEINKSTEMIGSAICLLDKTNKKAYPLFSNPISNAHSYAHTLLYQTIINWLNDNGYSEVDFCGANFESISYFKSYFNPTLTPYYVVTYKKNHINLKPQLKKIYKKLKQFFNS